MSPLETSVDVDGLRAAAGEGLEHLSVRQQSSQMARRVFTSRDS